MSSIERAMEKEARVAGAGLQEDVPRVLADADTSTVAGTDASVTPSPASKPDEPLKQKSSLPPSVEVVQEVGGAPVPPSGGASARTEKARIMLDYERLASGGFLVPNQRVTKESEEYQFIKRRLLSHMRPEAQHGNLPNNLVLVTSSVPGEGKTFTSVNLAISLAMEKDHTVLAIDADNVRQGLSRVLGVQNREGLFDILSNPSLRLEDLLLRTSIENLVILPSGAHRDNCTELLASARMRQLAAEIAQRYHDRVVLFDSPPVLATTTATALAPLVGQLLLITEAGKTKHETIKEALERLDRFHVTGLILNKTKQQSVGGYDYYSYYHPSSQ